MGFQDLSGDTFFSEFYELEKRSIAIWCNPDGFGDIDKIGKRVLSYCQR